MGQYSGGVYSGRVHSPAQLRPWREAAGFVIRWSQWVRDPLDGWDEVIEDAGDPTVYATESECAAAIALMRARTH